MTSTGSSSNNINDIIRIRERKTLRDLPKESLFIRRPLLSYNEGNIGSAFSSTFIRCLNRSAMFRGLCTDYDTLKIFMLHKESIVIGKYDR